MRKSGKLNVGEIQYSTLKIQDDLSVMCGYYCIYFIKERNRGRSMYDIIHGDFGFDTKSNEKVIHSTIKE